MVRVPVTPARLGNWFWNSMRMVGTSATQIVPAAPKVNVSGSVVEVVLVGVLVVVVVPGAVVLVVDDAVVVVTAVDDVVGTVDVVVVPGRVVLEEVVDG